MHLFDNDKKVHFAISFVLDGQQQAMVGTCERFGNLFKVTEETENSEGVLVERRSVKLFAKCHQYAVDDAVTRLTGHEPVGHIALMAYHSEATG
jgi:hypothetical protein